MFYPEPRTGWYEGGLITSVDLFRRSPEVMQKVVTAVVLATEFVRSNEEESIAVALRRIPYLDREGAEGNYKILRDSFSCDIEAEGINYMAKVVGEVKGCPRQISLGEVAELSFLQQAYREVGL